MKCVKRGLIDRPEAEEQIMLGADVVCMVADDDNDIDTQMGNYRFSRCWKTKFIVAWGYLYWGVWCAYWLKVLFNVYFNVHLKARLLLLHYYYYLEIGEIKV